MQTPKQPGNDVPYTAVDQKHVANHAPPHTPDPAYTDTQRHVPDEPLKPGRVYGDSVPNTANRAGI